jgi:hypothetical protein
MCVPLKSLEARAAFDQFVPSAYIGSGSPGGIGAGMGAGGSPGSPGGTGSGSGSGSVGGRGTGGSGTRFSMRRRYPSARFLHLVEIRAGPDGGHRAMTDTDKARADDPDRRDSADTPAGSGTAGPHTREKEQAGSYARDAEQDPERDRHERADADQK